MMSHVGEVLVGNSDTYTLQNKLGEGGFGITWRGTRGSDGSEVVVKLLRVERLDDWKALELFEREAEILEELDHPRIPDYYDHFTLGSSDSPEGFALVQKFIKGRTLRQIWEG